MAYNFDTSPSEIKQDFFRKLALSNNIDALERLRLEFFGRKGGHFTLLFDEFTKLSLDDKKKYGPTLHNLKAELFQELETKTKEHEQPNKVVDVALPSIQPEVGHMHPLTLAENRLVEIFTRLGFQVAEGPEIETDWFNFTALNIPENHPARDMWDTFYIDTPKNAQGHKYLLRTHTSPVQIRYMMQEKPPFAIIVPGRTYRNEATDSTHDHTFSQMEGLVVGKHITLANLIWTLETCLKEFFGDEAKVKVLPGYFPFTEPSIEVAISHPKFQNGRWVEVLGAGMVNQNVFQACGYKRDEYTGFAFGFGSSRFAFMKYAIQDIRDLSRGSMAFAKNF